MLSGTLNSPIARASDLRAEPIPPGVCDEVIRTCDVAIEKRNELIDLQANRIGKLQDDNERLQAAVVSLKHENDRSTQTQLMYGAGGIVLGIIAGILLSK